MNDYRFKAVIFDLDGVITSTAIAHSQAWKEVFDSYLKTRERRFGEKHNSFGIEDDYRKFVDGRPRYEGVNTFLNSRGIELEYGSPDDSADTESICGIGNQKNIFFNKIIQSEGVEVYTSTIELIKSLINAGIRIGVASSSKNCTRILEATGLESLFETIVDGETSARLNLKGKPDPDIFITAAANLTTDPAECVVVEDAVSGVAAGKAANFGLVVGVAREGDEDDLYAHGADIVVKDLAEIGIKEIEEWFENGLPKDNWSLSYHDYNPENERSRESLLSTGNGYFCTRGAIEESGINSINYPGTYIAGVYNKLASKIEGREVWNEDLVNVTNWLNITFRVGKCRWLDINNTKLNSVRRRLSFQDGVLSRDMIVTDPNGRTTHVRTRRLVSMHNPHIAAIEYSITPVNYCGRVNMRSVLSGDHINEGVPRYKALNQKHLKLMTSWNYKNFQHVEVSTPESKIAVLQTAMLRLHSDGKEIKATNSGSTREGLSEQIFEIQAAQGQTITLEKIVWIDDCLSALNPDTDPIIELSKAGSFDDVLSASAEAWKRIWDRIDITISGDRRSQKLIRLHLYHLISTVSPSNARIDAGFPARGLTGEAYRGHIFWDELYILPLYFLHFPEVARSLLMYRYHRLDAARDYAEKHGYKGAMFPWQSGKTGEEETQVIHYNPLSKTWGDDYSSLQRHVSLAVAFNIVNYHHHTKDFLFLERYGMEMLLEICRFWACKAKLNRKTGRYSISGVMGPDEFHERYPGSKEGGLRDNAYTNIMTAWLFKEIPKLLSDLMPAAVTTIFNKIDLKDTEIDQWQKIAENLTLVISAEGIIAQFDGYFELKEIDWDYYKAKYGDIHRLDRILKAEGKSPDLYKVSKQADTLMLFYNLKPAVVSSLIRGMGYKLPEDYLSKNFDYYVQRTTHGSTLSPIVHAYVAHLLGRSDLAWELFKEALNSDYNDTQGGTTAEGIHAGVMASTVMMAIKAFGGVDFRDGTPIYNPQLPGHWKSLNFSFLFRKEKFELKAEQVAAF